MTSWLKAEVDFFFYDSEAGIIQLREIDWTGWKMILQVNESKGSWNFTGNTEISVFGCLQAQAEQRGAVRSKLTYTKSRLTTMVKNFMQEAHF